MGDLTKNFSRIEFACPCCGNTDVDVDLVTLLQEVRDEVGRSVTINSAVRCEKHNADVGGVSNSSHVANEEKDCQGVDLACESSAERGELLPALCDRFDRIGIGRRFIHVDIDAHKPQNVVWTYYRVSHVA